MNLHKYLFSALCAMFLTLSFGCDSRRVEVYVHQETGCRSDTDCDAVYGETTYSWCEVDAGNGTCHYETLSWLPACSHDWECDDGNPDSTDTCSIEGCTHVIVERQGAELIVSQEALCREDGSNREVILSGGIQELECYTLNVFTDKSLYLDVLTVNTNKHATEIFSLLHVYVNGVQASSLFAPNGGNDVIDQWIFSVDREITPGSTVCIMANMESVNDILYTMGYLRVDLASIHATHTDGSVANVVLGANQNELRGVDHVNLVSDVNVISQTVLRNATRGETEIAKYQFFNESLEGKSSYLTAIEINLSGGPYIPPGTRKLRVYRGTSLVAVKDVTFGSYTPTAITVNLDNLEIPAFSTGTIIRVTLDTTGSEGYLNAIHADLRSYTFRSPSVILNAWHVITRDENPCSTNKYNYLVGQTVNLY